MDTMIEKFEVANLTAAAQTMLIQKYGRDYWKHIQTIANASKVMNTPETALAGDTTAAAIRDLKFPALYYAKSRFATGSLQILLKLNQKEWAYAGISRNRANELQISDKHTYVVNEVEASADFAVPGTQTTIKSGAHYLKAVAQ